MDLKQLVNQLRESVDQVERNEQRVDRINSELLDQNECVKESPGGKLEPQPTTTGLLYEVTYLLERLDQINKRTYSKLDQVGDKLGINSNEQCSGHMVMG